jgi:hypothetical protein
MQTNNTPELIDQLSKEFSKLITEYYSVEQLNEVRQKNSTQAYNNACATHDYFDANEVMAEVFQTVTGHEVDPLDETNCELWGAAWDLSKSLDFYNGY